MPTFPGSLLADPTLGFGNATLGHRRQAAYEVWGQTAGAREDPNISCKAGTPGQSAQETNLHGASR
eukprot:7021352-Pyramimonas_sp.AAC.1